MDDTAPDAATLDFDPDAMRERFRQERDKRLREDGEGQYIRATGEFAHYVDTDPFIERPVARAAVVEDTEVAIIGGGFSGLMAGARLREKGIDDFRILEAAGDFGGAWYWNRYPGAQCDIEGYIYLPLLEETRYVPREKYSFAAEIFEHCQRAARHYRLYENSYFQTKVSDVAWDEELRRWIVRTNRGDEIRARFVITAVGIGSRAKLPGIPGLADFEGPSFHTSHWDYSFTGGDPNTARWDASDDSGRTGKLDKLGDKVIAVIGTGATGIQCVPYLARDAEHLYVFQRTPNTVAPRGGNPQTDPSWAATLGPGWQTARRENFEDTVTGRPVEADLVADCWTKMLKELKAVILKTSAEDVDMAQQAELADFQMVHRIQQQISAVVHDPQVAEALKPWYRPGCKRPGFNDEYLEAFNRPNVTLVDVAASKGVERITKRGVIAGGVEYPVDAIVFATGFEIAITDFKKGMGFDVRGRGGQSLWDSWSGGIRSLHGHSSHGFPNWFYIGFSQNGLGFNQGYMLDTQVQHVTHIIAAVKARGATVAEVTTEAEADWVAEIRRLSRLNREFLESCTPGFYNNEGHLRGGIVSEAYSPGVRAFNALLGAWRDEGSLSGFKLS